MGTFRRPENWLDPGLHLMIASLLPLATALIAFLGEPMDRKSLVTFIAYYLILGLMSVFYRLRHTLTNTQTKQLLQLAYLLLGMVLTLVGLVGMLARDTGLALILLCVVIAPGLTSVRAGYLFKKRS